MTGPAPRPEGTEPAAGRAPEDVPSRARPRPLDGLSFTLAAVMLGLGLLVLWLVPLAEEADVPVTSRFAIFELAYVFLGRWGLFALFAGPAGLLALGGLVVAADDRPWLAFIGRAALALVLLVGLPVGGALGAWWAFGEGRWFWGSVASLVASFGALVWLSEIVSRVHRRRRGAPAGGGPPDDPLP